jgi:hypothetical protein
LKAQLSKLGNFAGTKIAAAVLVLIVIPAVVVPLVAQRRQLSPFDEAAHVDYLRRIEHLEIPREGDHRLRETLRAEVCRKRNRDQGWTCPLPGTSRRALLATGLAARGYSYESQQPPLYYAITAVLRLATEPFQSNFIESARLTGIFWLAGGLGLLYWAMRRLGAGHYASLVGCAVVACSPAAIWQTATVNNDGAAIVVGATALLLLTWLRKARGFLPWVVASLVAAACIWLKPTFMVAFVVAAVLLVFWRWSTDHLGGLALRLGVFLGVPTIAYFVWSSIYTSNAIVSHTKIIDALLPPAKQTKEFLWPEVIPSIPRMFRIYDIKLFDGHRLPIDARSVVALAAIIGLLLVATGVSWLFHARRMTTAEQVGLVTVGALLLLGPAYVWLLYVQYGQATGAHQRYALVLLPGLAAALALSAGNRARILVAALVAGIFVAEVVALT